MNLPSAHERVGHAIETLLLMRTLLLERWDNVVIERYESLRHPERAGCVVEAFPKHGDDVHDVLFVPSYKVRVDLDDGKLSAEFLCSWIHDDETIGRVEYEPARSDAQARGDAERIAGVVAAWLLLPPEKLESMERAAAEVEASS